MEFVKEIHFINGVCYEINLINEICNCSLIWKLINLYLKKILN